jgi:hypothetical protein
MIAVGKEFNVYIMEPNNVRISTRGGNSDTSLLLASIKQGIITVLTEPDLDNASTKVIISELRIYIGQFRKFNKGKK